MIHPKTAVEAAFQYFRDVYGDYRDPLLEEIEMTDDKKYWLVTIGFNVIEIEPPSSLEEAIATARGLTAQARKKQIRKFRSIRVNGEDGAVESLKARDL